MLSPDGINWSQRTPGAIGSLFAVPFGNGRFVAAGDRGVMFSSPDALDWTMHLAGVGARVLDIACVDGRFVAVGFAGTIVESQTAPQFDAIAVVPGIGAQVTVTGLPGQTCATQVSADLANWTHLTGVVLTGGSAQFTDSVAPNSSRRFYRAVSP